MAGVHITLDIIHGKLFVDMRAICLENTLRWRNLPKPTVAMVRGYCIFAGCMFASAMDIVNAVANALENTIDGLHVPMDAMEFIEGFRTDPEARVLDVRSAVQAAPFVAQYGERWQNIPQEELTSRLDEVKGGTPLWLICGSGPRSYKAQVVLRHHGIGDTRNIQGGIQMVTLTERPFIKSVG